MDKNSFLLERLKDSFLAHETIEKVMPSVMTPAPTTSVVLKGADSSSPSGTGPLSRLSAFLSPLFGRCTKVGLRSRRRHLSPPQRKEPDEVFGEKGPSFGERDSLTVPCLGNRRSEQTGSGVGRGRFQRQRGLEKSTQLARDPGALVRRGQ